MDHPDASKWNQRYREKTQTPGPCSVLQQQCHLLPETGIALDLACGLGGNSLFLAARNLEVQAWDISAVALARLQQQAAQPDLKISTEIRDLKALPPVPQSFDCIVVSYYLERSICPAIAASLKPGGVLFYQTFTAGKLSDKGPSSKEFLLENNELLQLFQGLEIRFYQENGRCGNLEAGDRDTAMLVAQKPRH